MLSGALILILMASFNSLLGNESPGIFEGALKKAADPTPEHHRATYNAPPIRFFGRGAS